LSSHTPNAEGSDDDQPQVVAFLSTRIEVDPTAYIAPNAVLVGEVSVGEHSSVWFGCVLRGDLAPIRLGHSTNVQDLTVVHVDDDCPTEIGDRVTIGHRCVIHGCRIEDNVLVGMGSVLLTGCHIGRGAFVAAGSVVREGFVVPDNTVVAGVPARVKGQVTKELRERIRYGADSYVTCADGYRSRRLGGGPHGGEGELGRRT
jgi:carbonic anhydrase/acetyltransferase-like protein (isoleucine patch superfamily)